MAALLWSISPALAQQTDPSVSECVQQQLDQLGVDRGDVPDMPGGKTQLPDLTKQTELFWCRQLGVHRPALQRFWPNQQGDVFRTRGEDAVARQDIVKEAVNRMRVRFADDWQTPIVQRLLIVGAGRGEALNTALNDARQSIGLTRPALIKADRFCGNANVGAFAGRGLIGLCWPRADRPVTLATVLPSIAHELMHQVQFELVPEGTLPSGDHVLGPGWMIEGSAEIIEGYAKGVTTDVSGSAFFDLQSPARRSRLTLTDLERSDAVTQREAYGVSRFAVLLLVRKYGIDAMFSYFKTLGQTGDRDLAFAQSFDMTFAEYADIFERVRRDFAAAQQFGATRD